MKTQFIMTAIFKQVSIMRIAITIFLFLSLISCSQQEEKTAAKRDLVKTDSVKVFVLKLDSAQKTLALPGELIANENVQIRAKVQGYIRKLNADIGTKVSKGQVLALIDAPEINTRVQELNEKLNASQSRYQASKDYYERIALASKTDGVIAANELQRAKNQMEADQSEQNAARFAAASYRQVGGYLAIIAPYTGVITKRNIEVGSFVGNAGDKPLFELEDNTVLRLKVPVPEIYTGAVLLDNSCELTTRSFPDKKFKAKLVRQAGSIDEATRSEVWEFEIPNKDRLLKAGSYADVKLHFIRTAQSLVVPVSAVVTTQEKKFVIRVSNNTTQWVDVRTGFNMGDKVEIFGEVKPEDSLVLKPTEELKSGTTVIPKLSTN
jgi:RND family efflux transporter MFP subunit